MAIKLITEQINHLSKGSRTFFFSPDLKVKLHFFLRISSFFFLFYFLDVNESKSLIYPVLVVWIIVSYGVILTSCFFFAMQNLSPQSQINPLTKTKQIVHNLQYPYLSLYLFRARHLSE